MRVASIGTGWRSLKECTEYVWLRYVYVFIEDKVRYVDVVRQIPVRFLGLLVRV